MANALPLAGIRVLDLGMLYAAPFAAMLLGDYGADVIKVEQPSGDPLRRLGERRGETELWWKVLARNKRCVSLDLSTDRGRELLLGLAATADVVVENFRPGTLERWQLGYEQLAAANPGLVLVRLSGFGQRGPFAQRAAFGTQAECLSGWVYATGEPDGPPILPPFGLADPLAGMMAAYAAMVALHERATSGLGQVVDTTLVEPMLMLTGPAITYYDQLGTLAERVGNRSRQSAPRNIYKCRDGHWIAISTSAQSVAERVIKLVGRADLLDEPWFAAARTRVAHADLLDEAVGGWIARHDLAEVADAFQAAGASASPINGIPEVLSSPEYAALDAIVEVPDEQLGAVRMQNVAFRMSRSAGAVRHAGRPVGADNEQVYAELLGLPPEEISLLRDAHVI